MRPASQRQLLDRIGELGPFRDEHAIESALGAALQALGALLSPDEREFVAAELPAETAQALRSAPSVTQGDPGFFQSVADNEGARLGLSVEHAQIVCRALAEALSPANRERLRRNLGPLGYLFELPETPDSPSIGRRFAADTPTDLAEGRPGATHPLAAGNPSELAHRHSIARSDDPHADTKLSSARGLRQEQEERTLAAGRPGSRRPLSSSH